MYVMLKMSREDIAKQIRDFTLSEYNGYFGSPPYVSVHRLFVESCLEKKLNRSITNDEKVAIQKFLLNVAKKANSENNHRALFQTIDFPKFLGVTKNFEKLIRELADKNGLSENSTYNSKPKKLSYTKLMKMIEGTEKKKTNSKYLDYVSARRLVSKSKLKSEKEWMKYCVEGKKPRNIPNNPQLHYSVDWKDWDDWLGILSEKYMSFVDAKRFVSNLNLETKSDWTKYCKTGKLPMNVPSKPQKIYSAEWKDWDDWLGLYDREYLSYNNAKEIISQLLLEDKKDWTRYCKSGKKPPSIPIIPDLIYKNEWKGWDDWLGLYDREYLSYNKMKQYLLDYGIERWDQWKKFRDSYKRPKNIPKNPLKIFKSILPDGISTHDFYGLYDRKYLSYHEASSLIRKMKFKNFKEYQDWVTSDKRLKNIPLEPLAYYTHKQASTHDDLMWYSWDSYIGLEKQEKKFD